MAPAETEVFIALGGNLGDRSAMLAAGLERLAAFVDVTRRSKIYETAPKYVTDQPAFLNMAVAGRTALPPEPLLAALQAIEQELGRVKGRRFGPRAIDLDILFYGGDQIDSPTLIVPHPRIGERRFVLQPLMDIAPGHVHPKTGATVAAMLAALQPDDDVRLYEA